MTDTLKVTTPSDRELTLTRVFDAPRHLVFEAWTKPVLLKRWLGVRGGWVLETCEIDLKVGGAYRYVWRGANDIRMGMGGVYREVVRPERLVVTEKFDDPWYSGSAIVTTTFVERDAKTTVATTVLYETREARDGVLKTPMSRGVSESYDVLAALLAATPAR